MGVTRKCFREGRYCKPKYLFILHVVDADVVGDDDVDDDVVDDDVLLMMTLLMLTCC